MNLHVPTFDVEGSFLLRFGRLVESNVLPATRRSLAFKLSRSITKRFERESYYAVQGRCFKYQKRLSQMRRGEFILGVELSNHSISRLA